MYSFEYPGYNPDWYPGEEDYVVQEVVEQSPWEAVTTTVLDDTITTSEPGVDADTESSAGAGASTRIFQETSDGTVSVENLQSTIQSIQPITTVKTEDLATKNVNDYYYSGNGATAGEENDNNNLKTTGR